MEVGDPIKRYEIDPLEDPVPHEEPQEPAQEPAEAPAENEPVPA